MTDSSRIFWSATLPICWICAPLLGLAAHAQALGGRPLDDHFLQSTLFLALGLAGMGLMGVRVVVGQAVEEHHLGQAIAIGGAFLLISIGLIIYGLSAVG